MNEPKTHSFHIPVLGMGYSVDTPVKVARYGISSVMSIMDDELLETMRKYHSEKSRMHYHPISRHEEDFRAKRTTAYLNLVHDIVHQQVAGLKSQSFSKGGELVKYFEMLPEQSPLKRLYNKMAALKPGHLKNALQKQLRKSITAGSIDVNIMAKVDSMSPYKQDEALPAEYSTALASLRGFANSKLRSSVIISAGYNPRLYAYIENFPDFYPDNDGNLKKKITLKVSDFRSALVQGRIFAKKGLWVSEYRIESGLNCGGHAFPTDGLLLGPILEEFKNKRGELEADLLAMCNKALAEKGIPPFKRRPQARVTVQGGIGTANENSFLLQHYEVDGTGWGSPFLLVPEATNVDEHTLQQLATATQDDYYLSDSSPLGVLFNNFRKSTAEIQRRHRIEKGRPGSPCYKRMLAFDTEFGETPLCTASRQYQDEKIKQLNERQLSAGEYEREYQSIIVKDCLCEGLSSSALMKDEIPLPHNLAAVTICPGPNLAYFSGVFSLSQMVGHIYGRRNLLNSLPRPNMFINELKMYVDYFKERLAKVDITPKQLKSVQAFKANLLEGIEYYQQLLPAIKRETTAYIAAMKEELMTAAMAINGVKLCAV